MFIVNLFLSGLNGVYVLVVSVPTHHVMFGGEPGIYQQDDFHLCGWMTLIEQRQCYGVTHLHVVPLTVTDNPRKKALQENGKSSAGLVACTTSKGSCNNTGVDWGRAHTCQQSFPIIVTLNKPILNLTLQLKLTDHDCGRREGLWLVYLQSCACYTRGLNVCDTLSLRHVELV